MRRNTNTEIYRTDSHVKIEAGTGVMMYLQAKGHQESMATPGAKRQEWNGFPPRAFRESMALPNLDFGLLPFGAVRKQICFKPLHLWYFVMAALRS